MLIQLSLGVVTLGDIVLKRSRATRTQECYAESIGNM